MALIEHRDTPATELHRPWHVGATDPSLDVDNNVGAGHGWVDTSDTVVLWVRNETNDDWDPFDYATHEELDDAIATVGGPAAVETETGGYTLVLADAGKWKRVDDDVTVPPDSSVAFPIGTEVHIEWYGAGPVAIIEGSGVTVNTAETLNLAKEFAVVTLKKVDTDEWTVVGYLEEA